MLKFGTLVDWMGTWEFFYILKVFLFRPLGPAFPISSVQPKEMKNDLIMLKFATFVDWMNTWGC